jgi:hypothetical protein
MPRALNFIGHIYTMLVAIVGWVMFRAVDLTQALKFIGSMFGVNGNPFGWLNAMAIIDGYTLVILLIGIVFSIPIIPALAKAIRRLRGGDMAVTIISGAAMVVLLTLSVFCLAGSGYNPFIYFRF